MRVLVCVGLLVAALVAAERVAAQGPAEPAAANVEVTVWRRISNPLQLYVSTRPEGGSWRTLNTALDMSRRSDSGLFHRSNAVSVRVPLGGTSGANVEVTVWRRISNPAQLYVSTRPEGGSWRTQDRALDMSRRSGSRLFHQSSAVLVEVPLPSTTLAATCVFIEQIARVSAATFQVQTANSTGTAFYIGDGEWITNHHVVEAVANTYLVRGETRISASVVGSLPSYDLALLSARPSVAIEPLGFASRRPELASPVTAVGFPSGVVDTPSVTRGVVSKHAPFSQFRGFSSDGVMMQVDAEINPGNSGGPIVDDCGAVVGVAVLKQATSSDGRDVDGIGFGIAAETVIAQLANLRSAGHDAGDTAQDVSNLTISAFCTYSSSEDLGADECHDRSRVLDASQDHWTVWAAGVVDFDNVAYRFNGGAGVSSEGVWDALLALGAGCHELEIAEDGISTHWSVTYEFCFLDTPQEDSSLTISAFCTYWSSEDLDAEECDRRASNLDTVYDRWNVWAQGVVDFDNVLYRFDGGASLFRADVREALLALGAGCHELEIAENGISTRWSGPYEFCFVSSTPTPTPTPTSSIPAIPTGLWVAKVDIPFAPDDIDVHWNAVAGATWYELWYHDGVQWQLKATTTRSAYRDESPSLLFADSYSVKACNNVGCSAFSAAVTQY